MDNQHGNNRLIKHSTAIALAIIAALAFAAPTLALANEDTPSSKPTQMTASTIAQPALSAAGGNLTVAGTVSENESNDTLEEATAISLNSVVGGSMLNNTSSSRFVGVTDYFDYDYFKIRIDSPTMVSVSVTSDVVMGKEASWLTSRSGVKLVGYASPKFNVYIAAAETVEADDSWDHVMSPAGTKKWRSGNLFLKPGSYYVMLYANASSNIWEHEYSLTVNGEAKTNTELSPNGTYESATPLIADTAFKGSFYAPGSSKDSDFYKFTLSKPVRVVFALDTDVLMDGSRYSLNFSVCTLKSYETTETWDWVMYPSETKKWRSDVLDLPAGTYFLRIDAADSSDVWAHDYTLKLIDYSNIANASIGSISEKPYTGKAIKPALRVKAAGIQLKANVDFSVTYTSNLKIGTATITIVGKGAYRGTKSVSFKIGKGVNPITVKAKSKALKSKSLKKKNVIVKKCLKVKQAKGKIAYIKVGSAKKTAKFKVNKKTGAITVPKGVKKGTYKVKVRVTAAGNSTYKAGSKTVTVVIRVR